MKVCQNICMSQVSQKIYCAFCKLKRRHYSKKHITWTNILLSALAALATVFIIWQNLNPVLVVVFTSYLILSEVFIQIRWRLSVVCPHCGFDAVLYRQSPERACDKVVRTLQQQKESGNYLLTVNDPFQNLPKKRIKRSPLDEVSLIKPGLIKSASGKILHREI